MYYTGTCTVNSNTNTELLRYTSEMTSQLVPTWLIEVIDGKQVLDGGVGDRIPAVSREMHARPLVCLQLNNKHGNVKSIHA